MDAQDPLNARVVVISFGNSPGAMKWLEETGVNFEVLLDPDREAYNTFGLECLFIRSYGVRVWFHKSLFTPLWSPVVGNPGGQCPVRM